MLGPDWIVTQYAIGRFWEEVHRHRLSP